MYQYVKHLIIDIKKYSIRTKNRNFSIFSIAEGEKIKSKYRIIWIIVSILNHIYRFYIYYCIINKSKIITLYAHIFEKNRNFDF